MLPAEYPLKAAHEFKPNVMLLGVKIVERASGERLERLWGTART